MFVDSPLNLSFCQDCEVFQIKLSEQEDLHTKAGFKRGLTFHKRATATILSLAEYIYIYVTVFMTLTQKNDKWYNYLTSTLNAPRGVTSVAGANAYAAKLAASPAPTRTYQHHHQCA